jgi:hypothetical protein
MPLVVLVARLVESEAYAANAQPEQTPAAMGYNHRAIGGPSARPGAGPPALNGDQQMLSKVLATCVAAGSILAFSACESSPSSETMPSTAPAVEPGMLNSTCPMSGEPVDPAAPVMEYHGYKIGLCCGGCVKGWNGMSEEAKLAFVNQHTAGN